MSVSTRQAHPLPSFLNRISTVTIAMKPFFSVFRSWSTVKPSKKQEPQKEQTTLTIPIVVPLLNKEIDLNDPISPTTIPHFNSSSLEKELGTIHTEVNTPVTIKSGTDGSPPGIITSTVSQHSTSIVCTTLRESTDDAFWDDTKALPFYFNAYTLQPTAKEILIQNPVVDKLLENHIKELHDRAWRLFPYPCVGMYEYVRFNLPSYPLHRELLELIRSGGKYLDVGCCFGQDIRYLRAQPGVEPTNLYGVELRQEFIDMGYDLFLDRETLPSKISQADIFDDHSWIYSELDGQLSVIHLSYILHLFDYPIQVDMVKRMMQLLNRKPGNMIVGKSVGAEAAGLYIHPTVGEMYRHSMITFRELWEEHSGCNVAVYFRMGKERRVSADGKKVFEHPATERAVELEFCVLILE